MVPGSGLRIRRTDRDRSGCARWGRSRWAAWGRCAAAAGKLGCVRSGRARAAVRCVGRGLVWRIGAVGPAGAATGAGPSDPAHVDSWARDGIESAALGERAFDRLRVCGVCVAAWWCGACAAAAGRDWSATWCAVWTRRLCGGHWNRGRCCVQRVRGPHPTWRFAARCGRFCGAAMAVEGRRCGIGMGCGCCAGGEVGRWGRAGMGDGQQ